MSDQPKNSSTAILFLSVLIFVALFATALVYLMYSEDKGLAAEQIWNHLKELSLLAAGYIFGERKAAP